ncbi:MAG TPA: TIR domain-containing protein [Candidatus Angelobacter sp.]|nr:TIR domain-containing protein [Candidatus Angelobacter sp.]
MDTRARVVLSVQRRENLSKRQQRFFDALQAKVESVGLCILTKTGPSDTIADRYDHVRNNQGVIVPVFSQWQGQRLNRSQDRTWTLPSEFTHIVATMAVAAERPLLVLQEKTVDERGAFKKGLMHPIVDVPASLDPDWLDSPSFAYEFDKWLDQVRSHRHVFLGYSTQASEIGAQINNFLTQKVGLSVFDWHDFRPGDTVWDSIERAERLTQCGVFLFMADDKLAGSGVVAPRDNVVYEAGYFAGAKGRTRSIIVREPNAKVPSDLGGILYLALENRASISSIETRLREHVERMFG